MLLCHTNSESPNIQVRSTGLGQDVRLLTSDINLLYKEALTMAKSGMRRPDPKAPHGTESNHKTHIPKNEVEPVPEIQGKAKAGHKKAKPM